MALQANQIGSQMAGMNMPQPSGGFFSNLKNTVFGTPARTRSPYSQQQQQGFNQLLQGGLEGIQNTPLNFQPIQERLLKTYNERIVPSLATRFSGMGSGGSQGSSAFRGLLGESSGDLLQRLGELESAYNLKGRDQALQLAKLGLTPQLQYQERQPGLFENLLGQGAQALGNYVSGGLSNLVGGKTFHGQPGISDLLKQVFGNISEDQIEQIRAILGR
jgi:hypothetical protein